MPASRQEVMTRFLGWVTAMLAIACLSMACSSAPEIAADDNGSDTDDNATSERSSPTLDTQTAQDASQDPDKGESPDPNEDAASSDATEEPARKRSTPEPASPKQKNGAEPTAASVDQQRAKNRTQLVPAVGRFGPPRLPIEPSSRGDSGPEVAVLQQRLLEIGFAASQPDGDYGRKTEQAVTAFQRVIGLPDSGEATEETMYYLTRYRYDGVTLRPDDDEAEIGTLQRRLADSPLDPGEPDGAFGAGTASSIWALEKLADIPVDGVWGPLDEWAWTQLMNGELTKPVHQHDKRWVEVNLAKQIMVVYEPDEELPVLISHISSGSGVPWENEEHSGSSVTPKGDFEIQRRISGWRESSLGIGRLYNPLYFVGGIAFHGATSVPLYPASHGCVRVPMHIASYLPDELPNGTPVHVMSSVDVA